MKKPLLFMLTISAVFEAFLGLGILLAPQFMLGLFKMQAFTPDIRYLATTIAWFCLFVTALVCLAIHWVRADRPEGRSLCIFMGFFWILIGVSLAVQFGRPEHLVLDALKGLLILIFAMKLNRRKIY
jgi:peptidoglycan/LPS O-acetylase OafA/YrhL